MHKYPDSFGMIMPDRKYSGPNYRFGFNGKESDKEVNGSGAQYDYGLRIYDSRYNRFLSLDPLVSEYPFYTPYQFAGNSPISAVDVDGAEGALSIFLPNAFSEERTTKIKNNLGVKKGSWADKAIDFVAGANERALGLNNPISYIKGAGQHIDNMAKNAYGVVTAKNPKHALNSAVHLGIPGLNNAEQMGHQAVTAVKNGDYRTMGAFATDIAATLLTHRIATAKAISSSQETVTYYRVQGGTPPAASKNLITIDANGNPIFSNSTLNVSVGNLDHATYFQKLRPGSQIVQFEVPKWMDDMIQKNAIPQLDYNSNPLNQGGLAPKIVDPTTPGLSYELPPIWSKWLNENAVKGSGKVVNSAKGN